MRDVLVKTIMISKAVTVGVEDKFSRVMEKMRDYKIRHLPVIDEGGRLVGMITQRDLLHAMPPRRNEEGEEYYDEEQLDRFILKRVMTHDPVCVGPDESLARVVDIMVRNKYGCIPVVAPDKTLVGVVTQIDVLKYLAQWLMKDG